MRNERNPNTSQLITDFTESQAAAPIFIMGIAPRSGTNFLHDLLLLHPDCDPDARLLEEDHLIANAHWLFRYINSVSRFWKPRWGSEELRFEEQLLCEHLGNGLISFLSAQLESRRAHSSKLIPRKGRRLVTKTPSSANLYCFFNFFPAARLIILIRDGRAVVESAVKTFDKPYETAMREWASSAREILDFMAENPGNGKKYLMVRYEDLYRNVEEELRRILTFLDLDPAQYDFGSARSLPVRGSSILRDRNPIARAPHLAPGLHWEPIPKPMDFNPVARWGKWSRVRHKRFNWIAGRYLEELGYKQYHANTGLQWTVWNLSLDLCRTGEIAWLIRRVVRRMRGIKSRNALMALLRDLHRSLIESVYHRPKSA